MKISHKGRDILTVATIVFVIISISVAFITLRINELSICDTEVVMKDGAIYECAERCSYDNGITSITGCDGSKISVPTIDIKFIKDLENEK
jgi:hypothetical protein